MNQDQIHQIEANEQYLKELGAYANNLGIKTTDAYKLHIWIESKLNSFLKIDAEDAAKYRAINTPEIYNFIKAVELEALHQRDRWGAQSDAGKADTDWLWLIGYLAGKAINKPEKALHHIITTAAACLNWHAAKTGHYTDMRVGTVQPDKES